MTHEELLNYFSKPMYNEVRELIYRVMLERPNISDAFRIEAAAERMHESLGDGAELTVEQALRLTEKQRNIPVEELVAELEKAGVTDGNVVDIILGADLGEDYSGCEPDRSAERKVRILNANADILAKNQDIIVLGRPQFFEGADWAQLALAVFCPTLSKDEQQIIQNMTHWCDEAKVLEENGYLKLIFYIKDIWNI